MKRLLLLVAVLLALPTAALAHGDTGTLELVSAEPAGEHTVDFVVRLTYEGDGDDASSADVRVVIDDAEPQPMALDGDGLYSATVTFPDAGEHAVRFEAEDPTATLEHLQVVSASSTDSTTSTTDAPNVAEVPLPDDAEGGSAWLLVLMTIIVVAMVVLAIAYVRGRRPPA